MAGIDDEGIRSLLEQPNYAVVSTLNADGSILSTVVWVNVEQGRLGLNSAEGRLWPSNLERDSRVTVLVYEQGNPYDYVEIRGRAKRTTDGADEHIDRLTQKYLGQDKYPFRAPGERRVKFLINPEHVRHVKQG